MISIIDVKDVRINRKKWEKCGEYMMRTENGFTILKRKKSFKFFPGSFTTAETVF